MISLPFPLISRHSGGLAGLLAGPLFNTRTGLEGDLRGWRAGWERLALGWFPATGCLGASVAVWIWLGSRREVGVGSNYGRGVESRLGRGGASVVINRSTVIRVLYGWQPSRLPRSAVVSPVSGCSQSGRRQHHRHHGTANDTKYSNRGWRGAGCCPDCAKPRLPHGGYTNIGYT